MQRHADNELNDLKSQLLSMAGLVEKAIDEVYLGMISKSSTHFDDVSKYEKTINQMHSEVDENCLRVLARQAPVASDLRLVLAVIKINNDLERMGDQAINIAHNAREYMAEMVGEVPADFHEMKKQVRGMVKNALDAFVKQDVTLCRQVLENDDIVDDFRNRLVASLKDRMKQNPKEIDACLNLIMIAKNMERLADHATNIAEDVIFVVTGDDVRHGRSPE
jgi:phosphate transport system protein